MTDLMQPAVDPDIVKGTAFTALMLVEGVETGEQPMSRLFELGTTSWRSLPLPLMVRDTAVHGPGETPAPTWIAGQLEQIERDPTDPSRILGRGHLMPNADGARAEELARHGFRGVSIDGSGDTPLPPELQPTVVDQDGDPIGVLVRFNDTVILGLTMVPTPAFEGCALWFDDETMPDVTANLHGAVVDPNMPPEVVQLTDPYEQLVASGGGPVNPPRDWFFTPEPPEYQPLEVTRDGRVTGHIAPAGQCHMSNKAHCDTAPPSTSIPPYKMFHRTVAQCDDGTEVACGWIAVDTKHDWDRSHVAAQVADHYDHTGTLAAKIRLTNGAHGIWASGVLLPGLDDRTLAILQGPEVSGHWESWTDPDTGQYCPLEAFAVLAVPEPAFPGRRTRPELLVASGGQVIQQLGHFEPCCDECNEETMVASATDETEDDRTWKDAAIEFAATMPPFLASTASAVDQVDATYTGALIASMDDPIEPLTIQERARALAKYDADARRSMAADGRTMFDGSYAVGDEDDVRTWVRALAFDTSPRENRTRRHVMRQACALGKPALIPSGWNADGSIR